MLGLKSRGTKLTHVTVGAALATATRLAARRDEAMNMLFGLEVTAGNKGRER